MLFKKNGVSFILFNFSSITSLVVGLFIDFSTLFPEMLIILFLSSSTVISSALSTFANTVKVIGSFFLFVSISSKDLS